MGDSGQQHQVTRLLQRWGSGDESALNELIELVYPELRRIASRYLQNNAAHTLQSTALVHEAYLKLVGRQDIHWTDRTHFYAVAARVIRGILVDHYRAQNAAKRGGGADHVTLDGSASPAAPSSDPVDLLDLDIALNELEQLDPQQARIVELRYFAGLSIEETAHATGISPATVKRDWLVAKAWIRRRLSGGPSGASSGS
jgi:RNA polymerase sigma factor (TIGR02999 family)